MKVNEWLGDLNGAMSLKYSGPSDQPPSISDVYPEEVDKMVVRTLVYTLNALSCPRGQPTIDLWLAFKSQRLSTFVCLLYQALS